MDSETFTEVVEGGQELPECKAVISKWIAKLHNDCPRFCALVVGQTGVGKSTLINNLLGEDVAGVGSNLTSSTSAVRSYEGMVEGVPVKLIDTPGLDDATPGNDERNLEEIKRHLKEETIHLIIYCTKISENRLHKGIIRTFKQYTEIGVDWKRTVIALTFADEPCPPSSLKKKLGFNMGTFFEDRVAEWRREIPKALAEVVHPREEEVTQIKINPTAGDSEVLLPNGKEWYNAFWLDVLAVLPPGAVMKLVHCHRKNIKYTEAREAPEWPENFTLPPPPPPPDKEKIASSCESLYKPSLESNTTQPRSKNPVTVHGNWSEKSTRSPPPDERKIASSHEPSYKPSMESNTTKPYRRKPVIVLKGEERNRFEHTLGTALLTGVAMAVGGVAAATVGVAAGALVVAGTVSAPVAVPVAVAVGAAAAVVGAGVAMVIGLWKRLVKKKKCQ